MILWAVLDLPANQHSQSSLIGLNWLCWLAGRFKTAHRICFYIKIFVFVLNMKLLLELAPGLLSFRSWSKQCGEIQCPDKIIIGLHNLHPTSHILCNKRFSFEMGTPSFFWLQTKFIGPTTHLVSQRHCKFLATLWLLCAEAILGITWEIGWIQLAPATT